MAPARPPAPRIDAGWTLFSDRDGVINYRSAGDYVRDAAWLRYLPGVLGAYRRLGRRFGHVFVVTNQQAVGKGLMTEDDLRGVHDKLRADFAASGARLDHVYACCARAADGDPCRKPADGMARAALRDFPGVDLARSVMIGDSLSDMGFGRAIGALCVFVGEQWDAGDARVDVAFPSVREATGWLLGE